MIQAFDFSGFYRSLAACGLERWRAQFQSAIEKAINKPDGNLANWLDALNRIPELPAPVSRIPEPAVSARFAEGLPAEDLAIAEEALLSLKPWRKGPFNLGGIFIDSEWRSDLKWERVARHITPLNGRNILDIGCGNGYYLFRMAEQGARSVIGIDPSMLFLAQFSAIQKFVRQPEVFLLPIGFEDLPENMESFDTLFSMGVFYHRRSPFDFLRSLRLLLKKGGELILETLVIEGDDRQVLVPTDRYARMNNVWFIPSAAAMVHWLAKAGFTGVKVVDHCRTTVEEQRSTRWMPGESFDKCLCPENPDLTIEGLPAPCRAIFIASR
jgi:tRNA (mo5U34)-methyltransferase